MIDPTDVLLTQVNNDGGTLILYDINKSMFYSLYAICNPSKAARTYQRMARVERLPPLRRTASRPELTGQLLREEHPRLLKTQSISSYTVR